MRTERAVAMEGNGMLDDDALMKQMDDEIKPELVSSSP